MSPQYSKYVDFLKDKKFVQWQLMPDKESDRYWEDFLRENPHLVKPCQEAIYCLKKKIINRRELTFAEKADLLQKIQLEIQRKQKRKFVFRFMQYAAAACVLVFISIFGRNFFSKETNPTVETGELIIGNLFEKEEIQLFTNDKAIALENKMHLKIDAEAEKALVLNQNVKSTGKSLDISSEALNKLVIPYGKRMQLSLSDGSKVWLNSGTVLEFPARFEDNKREIYLRSGEIYVEVTEDKNKPFYVSTNEFDLKVYGTRFNMTAYAKTPPSVVLVEGSVSLVLKNNKEQFLIPEQQAIYTDKGSFDIETVNVDRYISWKDGFLVFDKTPMTEVLSQIERYYNLSFNFYRDVNLQKRTCTGNIYLSDNLDNVMITIGLLTSTKHKREKDQIFIMNDDVDSIDGQDCY